MCVWGGGRGEEGGGGGGGGYGRHTAQTPAAVKIKIVVNDNSLEARNTSKKRK